MTDSQKSAMNTLLLYIGSEILAVGVSVGMVFLMNFLAVLGGWYLVRYACIVVLLISVPLIFVIPVSIAAEELEMGYLLPIILMVLFGSFFLILPIILLASACRVPKKTNGGESNDN